MNNLPNHNINDIQRMLNLTSMQNIATNLDDMLSKYVLECLVYTFCSSFSDFSTQKMMENSSQQTLTLNQLALQRRANLLVPKARYPDICWSPKSDENRDRLESMSTSREEASPIITDRLEMSPLSS
jgi:hypothetical protein